MLRITIHDCPRVLTVLLEGRLSGAWVQELERCWQHARDGPSESTLRVDLTGVTSIDDAGQAWLASMHRTGAEFIAPDCLTKGIVSEITQTHGRANPGANSPGATQ
jgi:anti-anti-sigma regulatory factor